MLVTLLGSKGLRNILNTFCQVIKPSKIDHRKVIGKEKILW